MRFGTSIGHGFKHRRPSERWQRAMDRYGPWFVLLMAPVVGVWAMTAMALLAGVKRSSFMFASFLSITAYAVVIALAIDILIAT